MDIASLVSSLGVGITHESPVRWEMNTFHPQLWRPGAFLDVVTQEVTVESRPLSPNRESLR